MLQRIFIVPQHCSMPNSSVLCKGKPDHVPRETHASGQIMPRDSKPKMELALSPSNSPTAHHAKTRIVWSPRLGAFLTDFLIPLLRQPPPTPSVTNRRDGAGTHRNRGRHQQWPRTSITPLLTLSCPGSLLFCRSENFRFSQVVGSGSNIAGNVSGLDEQIVWMDARKEEALGHLWESGWKKFRCWMGTGRRHTQSATWTSTLT